MIPFAQCSGEWENDQHNFVERMRVLHNLGEEESHSLIAIFCAESLRQDIKEMEQAPTEATASFALKLFRVGVNMALGAQYFSEPLKKYIAELEPLAEHAKKFTAKATKHRKKSHFTCIIDYLYCLCRDNGQAALIAPGNIDEFMEFVQKTIRPGNKQNQHVAEYIDRVVCKANGFFYMQEGKGKTTKQKPGSDPNEYRRQTIQTELSRLRKKYS
jgi:hypothetical protein